MTTPNIIQPRQPKGIPAAGQFAAAAKTEDNLAPLRLAPSPASVAAFAKRTKLATAPKPEPSYHVDAPPIPVRNVDLGGGSALDRFAEMYPDYDVWSYDENGEVVDFDASTADAASIGKFKAVISNGYEF